MNCDCFSDFVMLSDGRKQMYDFVIYFFGYLFLLVGFGELVEFMFQFGQIVCFKNRLIGLCGFVEIDMYMDLFKYFVYYIVVCFGDDEFVVRNFEIFFFMINVVYS